MNQSRLMYWRAALPTGIGYGPFMGIRPKALMLGLGRIASGSR